MNTNKILPSPKRLASLVGLAVAIFTVGFLSYALWQDHLESEKKGSEDLDKANRVALEERWIDARIYDRAAADAVAQATATLRDAAAQMAAEADRAAMAADAAAQKKAKLKIWAISIVGLQFLKENSINFSISRVDVGEDIVCGVIYIANNGGGLDVRRFIAEAPEDYRVENEKFSTYFAPVWNKYCLDKKQSI